MTPETSVLKVEKEEIKSLKFPKLEVLSSEVAKISRLNELRNAMQLSNMQRQKFMIVFEDDSSYKSVETTIWGVTEKSVLLKQSIIIPINRIIAIA